MWYVYGLHAHMYRDTHVHTWRPEEDVRHPAHSPHYSLESFTGPEARLASSKSQQSSCLHPTPIHAPPSTHTHTQCWGYKHMWLHTQALTLMQSHLPSSLAPLMDQIAFLHMPVICR